MRIVVNCGHTKTGAGSGAVGFINESNETRNVGNPLMDLLRQAGHEVINATVDSASTSSAYLKKAVEISNAQSADLFVSIHFNAGGGRGVEAYTYNGKQVSQAVKIPILGMGGIVSGDDAIEFMLAGATAISIGAGNFIDPYTSVNTVKQIEEYMEKHKIDDINSIIGKVEMN